MEIYTEYTNKLWMLRSLPWNKLILYVRYTKNNLVKLFSNKYRIHPHNTLTS